MLETAGEALLENPEPVQPSEIVDQARTIETVLRVSLRSRVLGECSLHCAQTAD